MRSHLNHPIQFLSGIGSHCILLFAVRQASSSSGLLPWLPPPGNPSKLRTRTHKITNKDVLRFLSGETHLPQIIQIFKQAAKQKGFKHDYPTYRLILNKLGHRKMFRTMELFLQRMKTESVPCDTGIFVDLIGIYSDAGLPDRAIDVFYRMRDFSCHCTERVFSDLLNLLIRLNRLDSAKNLFQEVQSFGFVPKLRNYVVLLRQLCEKGSVDSVIDLLEFMASKECVPDLRCYGSMIDWCSSFDRLDLAYSILDQMRIRGIEPDIVVYNTLINGFCRNEETERAKEVMVQMESAGIRPDTITFNTLMNGLCNAGLIGDGMRILESMIGEGVAPDAVTFTILMNSVCKQEKMTKLDWRVVLGKMWVLGVVPDCIILNILNSMFSKRDMINEALFIMRETISNGCLMNQESCRLLVYSFGKCKEVGGMFGIGVKRGYVTL